MYFAEEFKNLGKNALSALKFWQSQKAVLSLCDRKAPCEERFSIGYLQK